MIPILFRVALLAFHNALSDNPSDPLVVATFALAVHNGGDFLEASSIAKRITTQHDFSFHELLEPQNLDAEEALRKQVMHLAASIHSTLARMTDEFAVSRAMSKYPKAPHSDLVSVFSLFVPLIFPVILFYFVCCISSMYAPHGLEIVKSINNSTFSGIYPFNPVLKGMQDF